MSENLSAIGRIAYPNIATARARDLPDGTKGEPRHSVTLVFSDEVNLAAMKAECTRVALEKYPNGLPKKFKSPFRSGEERQGDDGSYPEGFNATDTFCEFWRYERFGKIPCVDQHRNDLLPSDIYAGMTGRVAYRAFCYDVSGNKGISLGLEGFQKAGDGPRIGAAPINPREAFGDLEDDDVDSILADSSVEDDAAF